jgi:hypothetical protein
MDKDEALKLAKECGATTYTNRHYPDATAVTFSPIAWEKFCKQALEAPVQPVAWVLLREDEDGFEPIQFYGGKEKPETAGELKPRFTLRPVCFADTTPPAQPAPTVQEPVALHAMAKRRVFDAIRGAYDLGYNDSRGARAAHGDSAPGYKGRDVESDHGGALISALERYTTPPAAQRPWVGLTDDAKLDLISDAKGIGGRVRSDAQLLVLLDMQEAKLKEKNT